MLTKDERQREQEELVIEEGDGEYILQLKAVVMVDIVPSAGFLPESFLRKGDQPQHWSICFDVTVTH